jgi:hypothetical protein
MDLLLMTLIITLAVVALAIAPFGWGVDSRPTLPDDHRR